MKLVFCCCCWSELTSNISQVVWSGCWILSPDWQQFSFSSYHRPRCKHGCRMMCLRGGAGFCLYSQSSWPFALFYVLAGKVIVISLKKGVWLYANNRTPLWFRSSVIKMRSTVHLPCSSAMGCENLDVQTGSVLWHVRVSLDWTMGESGPWVTSYKATSSLCP